MHIAFFLNWSIESKFFWKKNYFMLFYLQSYFFGEQSKFLILQFYWNKKFDHRLIYELKWKEVWISSGEVSPEKRKQSLLWIRYYK